MIVFVAAQGGVRLNLCSREQIFRIIPTPHECAVYLTLITVETEIPPVARQLFAHAFYLPTSCTESVRKTVSLVRKLFPQRHIKKPSETLPGRGL